MLEFETKIRKWGNSLGIILPKNKLGKEKVRENEVLHIIMFRKNPKIKKTFGMLRGWKSGQEIKDISRKELYG